MLNDLAGVLPGTFAAVANNWAKGDGVKRKGNTGSMTTELEETIVWRQFTMQQLA
jgi:hypothetical protein